MKEEMKDKKLDNLLNILENKRDAPRNCLFTYQEVENKCIK